MQLLKKQKTKKTLLILFIALGILFLGTTAYVFTHPYAKKTPSTETRPVNDVSYAPATQAENTDAEAAKKRLDEPAPAKPSTMSLIISRAAQALAGKPLNIRTIIEGATEGECTATLTLASKTIAKTSTITADASSYTCGIDIPIAEFSTSGQWDLSVIAKNGNSQSPPATQKVTINK